MQGVSGFGNCNEFENIFKLENCNIDFIKFHILLRVPE